MKNVDQSGTVMQPPGHEVARVLIATVVGRRMAEHMGMERAHWDVFAAGVGFLGGKIIGELLRQARREQAQEIVVHAATVLAQTVPELARDDQMKETFAAAVEQGFEEVRGYLSVPMESLLGTPLTQLLRESR